MTAAVLLQHMHTSRPPASPLEYLVVAVATLVTAYALVLAAKMTFRPGESDPGHIKRTILEEKPKAAPARSSIRAASG